MTEKNEPSVDTAPLDVVEAPSKARKTAAPKARKEPKNAVVGNEDTDPVVYSRVTPTGRVRTRKSLTVHHLQRRLAWLGYEHAAGDLDGSYGSNTALAVEEYQKARGDEVTGDLTPNQFLAIFEDDPNVTASVDVPIQ